MWYVKHRKGRSIQMESLALQRTMNNMVPPREQNSGLKEELISMDTQWGPHGSALCVLSQQQPFESLLFSKGEKCCFVFIYGFVLLFHFGSYSFSSPSSHITGCHKYLIYNSRDQEEPNPVCRQGRLWLSRFQDDMASWPAFNPLAVEII